MTRIFRTGALVALSAATLGLAACGPAGTVGGSGGIPTGEYVLVGMDGGTVPLRNVTLVVEPGSVSGRGPCNTYSATNEAALPAMQLTPIVSTQMMCKDMRLETRFLSTLQSATEMEFYGGVLKVKSPQTWLIFEHGHRADEQPVDPVEAARGTN